MTQSPTPVPVEPVAAQDECPLCFRNKWVKKYGAPPQVPEGGTTGAQPTNKEDAANGNENAIRHVAYAEGYRDGKAEAAQPPADTLATAPSPRIEAEPVVDHQVHSMDGGIKSVLNVQLPTGTKLYLAPPDRTPDARSTMAVQPAVQARWLIAQMLDMLPTKRDWLDPTVERLARDWLAASPDAPVAQADARSTSDAEAVLKQIADHASGGNSHAMSMQAIARAYLADRATRSADSNAEAAGMERISQAVGMTTAAGIAERWAESRTPTGGGMALANCAKEIRAEAAKLTTALHTTDETRVDGGAT